MPGFREVILAYCDTMEQLGRKLVRLYATALRLPLEFFDQPFKEPQYKLRMTHTIQARPTSQTTSSGLPRTPIPVFSLCLLPMTFQACRAARKPANGSMRRLFLAPLW